MTAKRLGLRRALELGADSLRFGLDYVTAPSYQPLPWRRAGAASRSDGVLSRWDAMLPLVEELEPRSALDLGCNVGWYTLQLAARGVPTVGVESFPPYYRTAVYAAKRGRVDDVAIVAMTLNGRTTRLLPHVDCTLLLSLWHHLVQQRGLAEATEILSAVWSRTAKVLFFESGEEEMGPEFGLPVLEPDPQSWFTEYLGNVCPESSVRHLGVHHGGEGNGPVAWRNLFAVVRR